MFLSNKMIRLVILFLILASMEVLSQTEGAFQIARLKYNGGGDWYNDPSAEINLLKYL